MNPPTKRLATEQPAAPPRTPGVTTIPPLPSFPPNSPLSLHIKRLQETYSSLLADQTELVQALQALGLGVLSIEEFKRIIVINTQRRPERMAAMQEFKDLVLHQMGREWHECQFGLKKERVWDDAEEVKGGVEGGGPPSKRVKPALLFGE